MRSRRNQSQVQPLTGNSPIRQNEKKSLTLEVINKQGQQIEQGTSFKLLDNLSQLPPFELISTKPGQTNLQPTSQKVFTDTNVQTIVELQSSPPLNNSQENLNQINQNEQIKDKFMILVLIIGLASYIGLGLYAIQISNPFQEMKDRYNEEEKVVVKGFFSVIIAFCITFIVGLLLKPFLRRNFKLTLQISLVLSATILIALVCYSFYIRQLALGIVSAIATLLIIIIGYQYFQNIHILNSVGQISNFFNILQFRYIVLLVSITLLILISIAFTIVVVTKILFSVYDNPNNQNSINFFAAAYIFLSYWINNTLISFYSFVIARHTSQFFFNYNNTQQNEIQTISNQNNQQQNTNLLSIANEKNDLINGNNQQPSLNSAESNIDNLQMDGQYRKEINVNQNRTPSQSNITKDIKENNIENLTKTLNNKRKENRKITPLSMIEDKSIKTYDNSASEKFTDEVQTESIKESLKLGMKQLGSIAYCSLVSQVVEFIFLILTVLIYGSGLALFYSQTLQVVREVIIKVNGYLSIIRIAYDQADYCSSVKLVSQQLLKKNYYFALAIYYSNQISQTIEFFCFITGFASGVTLIVLIDYDYWFLIFVFILLIFCITKTASKISVVSLTTILFSFSTFFDLLATSKNQQLMKSQKFQQIYLHLKQAKNLMQEEKDIDELY